MATRNFTILIPTIKVEEVNGRKQVKRLGDLKVRCLAHSYRVKNKTEYEVKIENIKLQTQNFLTKEQIRSILKESVIDVLNAAKGHCQYAFRRRQKQLI